MATMKQQAGVELTTPPGGIVNDAVNLCIVNNYISASLTVLLSSFQYCINPFSDIAISTQSYACCWLISLNKSFPSPSMCSNHQTHDVPSPTKLPPH